MSTEPSPRAAPTAPAGTHPGGPPDGGPGAHLLAAVMVVGAGIAALWLLALRLVALVPQCPGWASEGTIAAPASPRSALLCTTDGVRGFELWVPALVLLLVAAVVWLRKRRFLPLALVLVVAVAAPLVVTVAASLLPASCTEAQWREHGATGCERDEELR